MVTTYPNQCTVSGLVFKYIKKVCKKLSESFDLIIITNTISAVLQKFDVNHYFRIYSEFPSES